MKQCINCGKQLPDQANFCPYCAAVQSEKKQAPEPKPRRLKRRYGIALMGIAVLAAIFVIAFLLRQSHNGNGTAQQDTGLELEFGGHFYQLITEGMDWQEAEDYCEAAGGRLASISSQEEADAVSTILQPELTESDDGLGGFWIGAYKEIIAEAEWEWVNGSPLTYSNWAGGNPDNSGTVVKAVADAGHPWDDTPFEEHCPVYESEDPAARITPPAGASCKSMTYDGHTYILVEELMDWDSAMRLPGETGLDGYLVCFETEAEYTAVSAFMESDLEKDRDDCWGGYWIGLRLKKPETYEWKWISGEAFTYNNWADGQPDQSGYAVKIVPDWNNQWDDISGEKHCFVCEWDDPESVPGRK
ncbi:MAG: zinc-ribbon domain-containing protein [Eubacterium sp.]|nr:zinc-ribbon domain-containing protein [Eubacterium sp.]